MRGDVRLSLGKGIGSMTSVWYDVTLLGEVRPMDERRETRATRQLIRDIVFTGDLRGDFRGDFLRLGSGLGGEMVFVCWGKVGEH